MAFSLASLFVDIRANQEPFNKALDSVHQRLSAGSVAVGTFVGNVASMFAKAAIGAAGGLFEGTIKSASNLNEAISKTQTIFGDAAGTIITQTEEMAKTFGLPKQGCLMLPASWDSWRKGRARRAQAERRIQQQDGEARGGRKEFLHRAIRGSTRENSGGIIG